MKDVKARDIMSTAVHHVSPQLRLVDLENELSSHRISGAPVVERGNVIGIVSRSDVERVLSSERSKSAAAATYYFETDPVAAEGPGASLDPTSAALQSLRTLTVRDVMTREVISVPAEHPVVRVAELMRNMRIHRVLVIEDGRLLGIVTSLDIVAAVADSA
jgi:CBS domain-containing protein